MKKQKILFVCIHNSARSQMAEALLNQLAGDRFEAHSAGLEPGVLNPLAVEVMAELGIDISNKKTKDVFSLFKQGEVFSTVITVCDGANAERCPVFPGITQRLHWSFDDPAALSGSPEAKRAATRQIRDAIKKMIETWLQSMESTRGDA